MGTQLVTDGARLLRRYLTRTGQSVPAFCARHGLGRIQVQRYLNGTRARASVEFADAIERATAGDVPWHAWHPRTLAPAKPRPRPRRRAA